MTLAAALLVTWMAPHLTQAKTFHCRATDTPCLITSITEANTNGQKTNDIRLEVGTYTLTAVNNDTDGPNGLPSVTSTLTITGDGADTTIIAGNLQGRLVHAAASGTLTLEGLTLRGEGNLPFSPSSSGAGIWNGVRVTLLNSILTRNFAWATAAGIENHGTLILTNSTVAGNHANEGIGGIRNNGTVTLTNSALTDNSGGFEEGGIVNGGMLTLTNSTVAYNTGEAVGGITNYGTAILRNSTVAYNGGQYRGGIANGGTVMLQNTILALNRAWFYYGPLDPGGPDCSGGTITSLGNNLIGISTAAPSTRKARI
jgi:hypothetical protein